MNDVSSKLWDPRPSDGSSGKPSLSAETHESLQRRRWCVIAWSSVFQFILIVGVGAGFVWFYWPEKPGSIKYVLTDFQSVGSEDKWLEPYQIRFSFQGNNESNITDHRLIRIETEQFKRSTPRFRLCLKSMPYELRAQIFRVVESGAAKLYQPLSWSVDDARCTMSVPSAEFDKGDSILMVGLLMSRSGKLPSNLDGILALEGK